MQKRLENTPFWLQGGQFQTIWSALYAQRYVGSAPVFKRERWATPDDDFIEVDFAVDAAPENAPLIVLFHGLEGSSQSHYAQAFAHWARQQAVAFAVPHFRGCSGPLNRQPRAYHSGDFQEIDWILRRMKTEHASRKIFVVGISLGGNALMRWAQELGAEASKIVCSIASVCSPLDLMASGFHIGKGWNRLIYTPMFLRSMKPRALKLLALHPGLFERKTLEASRDLYEFDNVFTAPLHGFKNTEDYWTRASAKPRMADIQIPALALNALNDPFMPASSLPEHGKVGKYVTLWQPAQGGHVGFASGAFPAHVHAMPQAVGQWLLEHR